MFFGRHVIQGLTLFCVVCVAGVLCLHWPVCMQEDWVSSVLQDFGSQYQKFMQSISIPGITFVHRML